MLTTATTAFVEQRRRQDTGPGVLQEGRRRPFPCEQQQTTELRSKATLQKTPTQLTDSYVGLTNSEGALRRETQATSPKGILKALTNCTVHLLLSISSGDFLHRKVLCILPYQNKVKIMLKISKNTNKKTPTATQLSGAAFNADMPFILLQPFTEVSGFPISLLH